MCCVKIVTAIKFSREVIRTVRERHATWLSNLVGEQPQDACATFEAATGASAEKEKKGKIGKSIHKFRKMD